MAGFAVDGLDHVQLRVREHEVAVTWCGGVLGLAAPPEHRGRAAAPRGPQFLATPGRAYCAEPFAGEPEVPGDHTIAFHTGADRFAAFLDRLDKLALTDRRGGTLGRDSLVDHGGASPLRFRDPDSERIELTTCEVPVGAITR